MSKSSLTLEETKDMFIFVSEMMKESKDRLTEADKAIGDGDHGIGMNRGFEAVRQKLKKQSFDTLAALFKTIGTTLMASIGGAAGAVFGTLFIGGAQNLGGKDQLDSESLSLMLQDGLLAIKKRGKAKPGDKTMIDALEPASLKSKEMASAPLSEALKSITEQSKLGMEKTKDMVATVGKAKTLSERSLGYPDPGSVSTYLLFNFMMQFLQSFEEKASDRQKN
jgi:dihydroxyacetone kinase-like protein